MVRIFAILWEHRNGEWGDHVTLQAAADWVLTQPKLFLYCIKFACKKKVSLGILEYECGNWNTFLFVLLLLQFGVRMFVITSFKDTCYIEILPHLQKSNRRKLPTNMSWFYTIKIMSFLCFNSCCAFESVICLSFWAEVHYNSIYPEGGMFSFLLYDYNQSWFKNQCFSLIYWVLFFLCSWNCVELIPEGKKKKKYWVFWALFLLMEAQSLIKIGISIC